MSTSVRDSQDLMALSGDAASAGADGLRWRRVSGALYRRVGLPVLGVVVVVGCWWWATWYFEIRSIFLPSPPAIARSMHFNAGHLAKESWTTIYETLAGFGIGGVAGLLVAAGLATSQTLERAALPIVVALNAIPKVALAPLLIFWLGIGHAPKIALAASICFFPIMIATMAGLNSTPAELGELARSLSASRRQEFFKIRVPWALPQVFVGLKLGITLAVIGTVVAGITRPNGGLGTVILNSQQTVNTPLTFAAIILLSIISISLFYLVVLAERRLLPWAEETTATRT